MTKHNYATWMLRSVVPTRSLSSVALPVNGLAIDSVKVLDLVPSAFAALNLTFNEVTKDPETAEDQGCRSALDKVSE